MTDSRLLFGIAAWERAGRARKAVPPDTPAYARGGEAADVDGFNAKSFAGQMIVGAQMPVTFCFIVNWMNAENDFPRVEAAFFAAIRGILSALKQIDRRCSSACSTGGAEENKNRRNALRFASLFRPTRML